MLYRCERKDKGCKYSNDWINEQECDVCLECEFLRENKNGSRLTVEDLRIAWIFGNQSRERIDDIVEIAGWCRKFAHKLTSWERCQLLWSYHGGRHIKEAVVNNGRGHCQVFSTRINTWVPQ